MVKKFKEVMVFALAAMMLTSCSQENQKSVANMNNGTITIEYAPEFTTQFKNYITVEGTKLMDGNEEIKFVSLNYPQATSDNPWEQKNTIKTVKAMGGNVTRSYTIPVWNGNNAGRAYVTGVDEKGKLTFDEDALNNLDHLLAVCNEHGIRVIIPLVDHWHWIGGMDGYVWLAKESDGNAPSSSSFQEWAWKFYSSETCRDYFKQMITHLLDRTNTVTGVKYKDDPAVFCWETANEAGSNQTNQQTYDEELSDWTIDVVNHIKSLDTKHLVLDGRMSTTEQSRDKSNPSDILGAHYYEGNYATRCADDTDIVHAAGKPFILGEFGAKVEAEPCIEVFQAGVEHDTNGIMMWSLRGHKDGYGYYFHDEDGYWAAYHWPGFISGDYYGETEILRSIYAYAQIANGNAKDYEEAKTIAIQAPETEEAPLLYDSSFTDDSVGDIKWRGVVGGAWYEIQRADGEVKEDEGEAVWTTIADESDYVYDSGRNWEDKSKDCIAGYHDETAEDGKSYSYRLRACNESGEGLWSNIVTIKNSKHVVYDDFDLIAVSSTDPNPTEIRNTYSYDHSANVENDNGTIINNSETNGYIEYEAIIPISEVVIKALSEIGEGFEPKIFVSVDGINYKELDVEHKDGSVEYSVSNVSKDDKYYYTRLYLSGNGKCQLDGVSLTYRNDGKSYRQELDGAKVSTNVMLQDNTFGIDNSPNYIYKSTNWKATTGNIDGITTSDNSKANIIYKTGDNMNAYRVVAYVSGNMVPKIEYSYDGVTYHEASELISEAVEGYEKKVYGQLSVTDIVRVIRITVPEGSQDKVILKSVEVSSGTKSIPLADVSPNNTLEDGEYYFGRSENIKTSYEVSNIDAGIKFAKPLSGLDYTAYDCVFAWIKPDDSGNMLKLQFTDKNGDVWSSKEYELSGTTGAMQKFDFKEFTCDTSKAMDLSEISDFEIIIFTTNAIESAAGSVDLNQENMYTGNYGVALNYAFDGGAQNTVYVDSIYASSSTKVDDFEGYNGSTNLLNAAYVKNANGGTFDMTLDSAHKSEGSYGLKIDYDYGDAGYAGATKTMDLLNLAGYDGFVLYVESDGSKNDIKVQIETDISTFSYTGFLTGEGPMIYYMPFSMIQEEAWAGTGHVLDSTQNLKSVSIYTDVIGDVTSGTFYVDDLKGANYVADLESKTKITMDLENETVVDSFPYTISGTAQYVQYISLSIGDKVLNIPVDEDGKWSYTLTRDSGIDNGDNLDIQAGFYYPNGDMITVDSDTPKKISIQVSGNEVQ